MIKKINYDDTFSVRHPVLRAGKKVETCLFDGDKLESTIHFGYFYKNELVGVASVYHKYCEKLLNIDIINNHYQIRGMAVLEKHQKKGIGKLLIAACEKHIQENNQNLIWFNARIAAVGFYEKLNYQKIESSFYIKNVGEHYLMFKRLVGKNC